MNPWRSHGFSNGFNVAIFSPVGKKLSPIDPSCGEEGKFINLNLFGQDAWKKQTRVPQMVILMVIYYLVESVKQIITWKKHKL